MTDLTWFKESGVYLMPIAGGESPGLIIHDGYSQWNLGAGADFELSEELKSTRQEKGDYSYAIEIKNLLDTNTDPMRSEDDAAPRWEGQVVGLALPVDEQNLNGQEVPRVITSLVVKLPVPKSAVAQPVAQPAKPTYERPCGLNGDEVVIIGIIDDSINIVHERFLSEGKHGDSSRVDFAWIQDASTVDGSTTKYGREWTRSQIDDILRRIGNDEDELLEALDLVGRHAPRYRPGPLRRRMSHGTHVADLAAGYDAADPVGVQRRLIAVQLPALASQDSSGASLIASIFDGIHYLFDRALIMSEAMGVAIPVVVNFSYGFGGGGRNSFHVLERAFIAAARRYREQLARKLLTGHEFVPVEFAIPAGNMHLSRNHAATTISQAGEGRINKKELTVDLCLQPEDLTSSYVEVWFPNNAADVRVNLTRPDGRIDKFDLSLGGIPEGQVLAVKKIGGTEPDRQTIVARIKLDAPNLVPLAVRVSPIHEYRLLLCFAPTMVLDGARSALPHGRWKIQVCADVPNGGRIEAWIQRDESVSGLGARGRQAYFDDDLYTASQFDPLTDLAVSDTTDSQVRRDGTLSGIASGRSRFVLPTEDPRIGVTIVGGYRWRSKAASVYSAAGSEPVADLAGNPLGIPAPHVLAVADTSRVLPGVLAAGSKSGSRVALNGTSIASPQVARLLADAIGKFAPMDRHEYCRERALSDSIIGETPRPSPAHSELASQEVIRQERVAMGLVDVHKALSESVRR